MVGISVLQGKGRKVVLHCLGPTLLPVDMGIIEQVAQGELQGKEEQGKGQKFFRQEEASLLSQTSEA